MYNKNINMNQYIEKFKCSVCDFIHEVAEEISNHEYICPKCRIKMIEEK